ncbi:hypothetical protein F2Q69_00007741 [Brassica cretica]|uniref:Uncharacterized protein n=1 Tax=Brassica cretica TaxID=69181 RepID=A0A8S9NZC9_BRACR|nr:hypothetical protein F2Q69_00007741 [Brassica cretica]
MSKSISVDDQQQEWTNHVLVNSYLGTNLGQRPHEIMSTHILQAQGQRGTKVIGKTEEELANIRETPCFRRVYPKTFGFQANQFHKLWVSRGRSPQTSMFQKGLPQNLRVPSEPVPQTLGFSILESGCRFFRRSFSSRYPIMGHISKKKTDLAYHCNMNPRSRIPTSERGNRSPTVNRPKQATSLGISIRPLSISGKSTLLQVQTPPRPEKNPEKETSERRPVHAKPKEPATDNPVLMPTEASSVSPSGLTPTRENYFRPRAPLNPETSTRSRSVPGKFVPLQVILRVLGRNREIRGKLVGKNHPGLGQDTSLQVLPEELTRSLLGMEHITYNAKVLPEELTCSLSGREHIIYNARYCLRSLHAYSQAGSILNTNAKLLYSNSEFVQGAIMGMRHKAGMGLRKPEEQSKSCFSRRGKQRKHGTWVITPTPAPSKQVPGVVLPRKAEYGPYKNIYSGFLRTLGLKITRRFLLHPEVVLNLEVALDPEVVLNPGLYKNLEGPYSAVQGKSTPGTCSDFAFYRLEAGHYRVHMLYSTYEPSVRLTLLSTSGEAGFRLLPVFHSAFDIGTLGTPMGLKLHRGLSTFALYVICSLPKSELVSSSGSTFALYVTCSLPESKRDLVIPFIDPEAGMDAGVGAGASLNMNLEAGVLPKA